MTTATPRSIAVRVLAFTVVMRRVARSGRRRHRALRRRSHRPGCQVGFMPKPTRGRRPRPTATPQNAGSCRQPRRPRYQGAACPSGGASDADVGPPSRPRSDSVRAGRQCTLSRHGPDAVCYSFARRPRRTSSRGRRARRRPTSRRVAPSSTRASSTGLEPARLRSGGRRLGRDRSRGIHRRVRAGQTGGAGHRRVVGRRPSQASGARIGSALFDRIEARASELLAGVRHRGSATRSTRLISPRPRCCGPWAPTGPPFLAHADRPRGAVEPGPAPDGIEIGGIEPPGDLPAVHGILEEAFADDWGDHPGPYDRGSRRR